MADLPLPPRGAVVMDDGSVYLGNRLIGDGTTYDISDYTEAGQALSPADRTWGDITRQNVANAKEVGANAGIGAAGSLAQLALGAIKTPQDVRNAEELAKLNEAADAGRLGLSADERSQAEATILNPARTQATEAMQRTSQQLAAAPTSSLSAQAALTEANQRAAQKGLVNAGIAINQANIDARNRQMKELEQRTAYESNKTKATLDKVSQDIGALAQMGGKVAAAQAGRREPTDAELMKWAEGKPAYKDKTAEEIRPMWKHDMGYDKAQQNPMRVFGKKKQDALPIPDAAPDGTDLIDASSTSAYGG